MGYFIYSVPDVKCRTEISDISRDIQKYFRYWYVRPYCFVCDFVEWPVSLLLDPLVFVTGRALRPPGNTPLRTSHPPREPLEDPENKLHNAFSLTQEHFEGTGVLNTFSLSLSWFFCLCHFEPLPCSFSPWVGNQKWQRVLHPEGNA